MSVEKLKQLQAKIKQTQEALQNNNQTQIQSLTREDILGDMVYAGNLSYYAQLIAQAKMATRPLKTHFELVGSSGIIGYKPQVDKLFGMPIRLTAGGMSCDLIDAHMTEHANNDQAKHVQANRQIGMIGSALEHQVLEQLFAQNGEQGFSAVKAIQLANEQGQKIYTITKENYQAIIPQLQLAPAAIADIKSAAQAGLTVTTHEKRISINGYTGEGYIILNDRGTGAYMINGGLYGGFLPDWASNSLSAAVIFGSIFLAPLILSIQIIIVSITIALIVDGYLDIVNHDYGSDECNRAADMFGILYGGMSAFAGFKIARNFMEELELLIISVVTISAFGAASTHGLKGVCK